jgi:hypothetical protein
LEKKKTIVIYPKTNLSNLTGHIYHINEPFFFSFFLFFWSSLTPDHSKEIPGPNNIWFGNYRKALACIALVDMNIASSNRSFYFIFFPDNQIYIYIYIYIIKYFKWYAKGREDVMCGCPMVPPCTCWTHAWSIFSIIHPPTPERSCSCIRSHSNPERGVKINIKQQKTAQIHTMSWYIFS